MSNYQVNLQFTADVAQARSQVQSLQQQLTSLINTPVSLGSELTPSIQAATTAAAELKVHLQNAMNVNTGVLDFGKLNNSIKQSGMTLSEYGAKLQSLGPKGQQAFMTLANSVAAAEVPLRRSSGALTGLMTTLKNTAKWQLSSSLLHGFISSVQSAYSYAQDLNESLNNIRIVTGQNIEQMARFAQEANKAAKALSTTTTEYTNASLIYYQQGLNDAQVRERTDVTIKMANASRQSAEIVSDQLTAIWNNFDNGTKTLEYYADVVTALGAATASSSEEIATGLEKFASVAETVGLSYEYATAALATVTATTRQSADVVGTAFKTLFARLQDLKLGETLDDGTTLGTYSENLRKVGVEIKDSSGQLKDMDIILDEVAAKWRTLDRDQQVALAKGVAGIRQYNTFMSLMSNWDFMEENLKTVEASGGTLQKQADIYAESWEAAQKRVKASAEKLYSALFDDKFFIELTNGFGKLIDKVGAFVQSIGGLQGVLSGLGLIVTKVFAQQMAQGFRNLIYNIKMSTEAGRFAVQEAKKLEMQKLAGMMAKSSASSATEIQTKNVYSQELQLQTELIANSERMTAEEQKKYSILLEQRRAIGQQSIELQKQIELLKEQNANTSLEIIGEGMLNNSGMTRANSFKMMNAEMDKLRSGATGLGEVTIALQQIGEAGMASEDDIMRLEQILRKTGMTKTEIKDLQGCFNDLQTGGRNAKVAIEQIKATISSINSAKIREVLQAAGIEEGTAQYNRLTQALHQYITAGSDAYIKQQQLNVSNENLKVSFKSLIGSIREAGVNMSDWATHLTGAVSGLMSAGMLISSINGLMTTLEDPDSTGWEKFGSILTSVSMIVFSFSGAIKGLVSIYKFATQALNADTLAKIANAAASYLQAKASQRVSASKDREDKDLDENTARTHANTMAKNANAEATNRSASSGGGTKVKVRKKTNGSGGQAVGAGATGTGVAGAGAKKLKPKKVVKVKAKPKGGLKPNTMSTLGKFAGGVAMVAAAIAVVSITITAAVAQFQRFEQAAQDAAIASEQAASAYQDAKSVYEDFDQKASDYQDSIDGMKELTKGTIEYTEAMLKANEQAMDLINNYKELAGQYTIKDGLIIIDEEALAKVQQQELDKLGKTQSAMLLSEIEAREARAIADKTNFNREMNSSSDDGTTWGNGAVGAVAGGAAGFLGTVGVATMIGSSLGPVGMIIGAAVGAIIGAISGIVATEVAGAQSQAEVEATNNVITYVQRHGNDIFGAKNATEFGQMLEDANLKIDDDNLVKSLYDNRKALEKLTAAELARLKQDHADWEAAYGAHNTANSEYINAENQTYLNKAGYNIAHDPEVLAAIQSDVDALWKGSNDDFWKAYLEEVKQDTNVDEDSTTGDNYRVTDLGGGYVTLQKKNEEGTWENVGEADSLSEEAAAQQLVAIRAMAKASGNITEAIESYEELSSELESAGLDKTVHADVINSILPQFEETGGVDLSSYGYDIIEILKNNLGNITNQSLKNALDIGIKNYEDSMHNFYKSDEFKNWYSELTPEQQSLVWKLEVDSASSVEDLENQLDTLQGVADGRVINYKLKATDELESLITADVKDWDKIWDQYAKILRNDETATKDSLTDDEKMEFASLTEEEMLARIHGESEANAVKMYGFAGSTVTSAANAVADAQNRLVELEGIDGNGGLIAPAQAVANEDFNTNVKNDQWLSSIPMFWGSDAELPAFDQAYWKDVWSMHEQGNTVLSPEMRDIVNILANGGSFEDYIQTDAGKNNYILQNAYESWATTASGMPTSYVEYQAGLSKGQQYSNSFDGVMKTPGAVWDPVYGGWNGVGVSLMNYHQTESFSGAKWDSESGQWVFDTSYGYNNKYRPESAGTVDQYTAERDTLKNTTIPGAKQSSTEANINLHNYTDWVEGQYKDLGLNVDEVNEQSQSIQDMAGNVKGLSEDLATNGLAAKEVAKEMLRYNRAVDTVSSNYENWMKILKKGTLSEQIALVQDMQDAYGDLLDIDGDLLSQKFVLDPDMLQLMEDAINGNVDAYNKLQAAAAENIYSEQLGEIPDNIKTMMTEIAAIDKYDVGDLVQVGVDDVASKLSTMYDTAVRQAIAGGKSVAEAMAIANSIMAAEGFSPPEIEMVQKTIYVTGELPSGATPQLGGTFLAADGTPLQGYSWSEVKGGEYSYAVNMMVPSATKFTKSAENFGGKKSPSKGGGGGSKKKAKEVKKSDVVERYKEITDSLDNNAKAMEDASRAADRLYGKDRLSKMREANKLLQKEIDLTKQKRKEAEAYLKEDRAELEKKMAEAGINFTFDAITGDITNYTEEMTKLYEQLDAKIQSANKDGNASEKEQEEIDAIQEKIDAVKDALGMYEETKELIEDLDTELEEKFNEWQDANFDILNTELELKIEINDMDLQRIEYYLGKIEDDFYQMAEAAALMVFDSNGSWGGQLTSYTDQLESQVQYLSDLEEKYHNNEISQASYIEGLKNASSAIYEQLGNLQKLDATMMEYYSETLAAAGEEIAKYTDLMESASGVLEHYTSLAELMGKSTDYKYMGNILSSQAKVASDAYKVSKANYDMLKDQEADREKAYKDAYDALKTSGATDEELANNAQLELLEQQWWDAQAATAEAQDQMLSDAEAWAEALGAILDNALSKAAQNLENTLADGFGSFDAMNSAFERKNALQEEYLTTTNKIYETNKLMRTAQQEIDKTTNEAAKRKLKQFINETDALQDQTELSQYELEIQQMKYDLLLAEIALEEAQNAKSTVRLQRDNEGNMSYVYTADANKVADAQQKFEDAQNALYNKGLEGANDYVQKYQETMQEMYDTLTEIDQNYRDGAYESELEYQKAIEEAKEYYYKKLTQYSNLYQVALTTDTRVAADAWTTEFASMTERTGDWMTAVNGYINEVKKAFGEWKTGMDLIHTDTLANIDQDLQNIESDSGKLATTVTKELIPALGAEMDAVADITEKYATFREELEKITTEYEEMAKAAENAIKAANGLEDGTDSGNPGDGNENKQNNDEQESNPNNNNNNGNTTTYIVQVGDTLSDIGAKYGVSWQTIYEKNKNVIGNNPNLIFPGQVLQFASGGYTGSWAGSYGKLAFLHQKELILNQHDTENFLASIEILEHILQMIDLQATSAQLGGILTTPKFSHYNDGILEQNVHIEASFPGVTDHNEVELAMTNLINTASQYANRK